MGLTDLITGRPSPAQFARIVTRALRRAVGDSPVEFDAQKFCLHVGGGDNLRRLFLRNLYERYLFTPRLLRRRMLHAVLADHLTEPDLPTSFETARASLRPQVRERYFFESLRMQFSSGDDLDGSADIPHRVFAEHLALNVAIDEPNRLIPVNREMLETWDVTRSCKPSRSSGCSFRTGRNPEPCWRRRACRRRRR